MRGPLLLLTILALACDASALELTPTQAVFEPGEDIEVVAWNDSSKLVLFGSSAPYIVRNLDTGETVSFVSLPVMLELEPGERMSFGVPGGVLEPGNWALEFHYWEGDYERHSETVEFRVAETNGAPAGTLPVTALKQRYRSG